MENREGAREMLSKVLDRGTIMKALYSWIAFLLLLSWVPAAAEQAGSDKPDPSLLRYHFPPVFLMQVLDAPHKARVNGQDVVCYELVVTNLEDTECRIQGLECLSEGLPIASYQPEQLVGMSRQMRLGGQALEKSVLAPGETAVLYLWLANATLPRSLTHRLQVDFGKGPVAIEGAETQVSLADPVQVGLPFHARGRWAAIGAPSNEAGHRRAVLVVNGRPWVSQRFAIDWVLLGDDGLMARGDGSRNEDHYCYGVEALAVADGEIVDTYDQVPSQQPSVNERAVPITLETVGGNWVALKIADNRYGMYAHLIPGSLRVKKGDKVKKGDVLGLVGNTGNSTAPHLHFHVSTTPSWISSVGLPYRIDSYTSAGKLVETDTRPEGYMFEPHSEGEVKRADDLPTESEVIWVR